MRIVSEKQAPRGKRRVTVEIDPGERIVAIREDAFYRLGYPLDDQIVRADMIQEAVAVSWCVIEQRWTE